jgi:hypothetical protein
MFQVHKQQVKLVLCFVHLFFRFLGSKQRHEECKNVTAIVLSCLVLHNTTWNTKAVIKTLKEV